MYMYLEFYPTPVVDSILVGKKKERKKPMICPDAMTSIVAACRLLSSDIFDGFEMGQICMSIVNRTVNREEQNSLRTPNSQRRSGSL
jgi:hypothetical protein